MPLPPNNSRAHATVSRHFAVVKALASAACASFSFPSACNWAVRTIMHCDAKMLANITASQCMIVRTAQLQAEGKLNDAHAALAKAFTTAKCRETVAWARELLGGNGISADYNVGRFFNDSEALYSYEGTYQMQNLIVGKAVTGFSAFL